MRFHSRPLSKAKKTITRMGITDIITRTSTVVSLIIIRFYPYYS